MRKKPKDSMFKLSQKFLEKYEGQQPKWGFGALSYFTFKRTYARIVDGKQEEYFDTCKRVVEGVFRIQEKHCKQNKLPWNGHLAQKSAQEMFTRLWLFKWTPPGRGFWIMGTELVDKLGSAALNNCGYCSTKNIEVELASPFAWAMDMLMLGVGVGFDTRGAGKVTIRKPQDEKVVFEIPDTREGWVESVRLLINSYQGGLRGPTHTIGDKTVIFDYSKIRLKGAPIKGFGGTASGPAPLQELHESIRKILDSLVEQAISSVAITDLFNLVGKCVVAGNVRRSAELAIGEIDDVAYVTMKDYTKFPEELRSHRWASNNSVFATPDSPFEKILENIQLNGEPGLIFIENARHYGRMRDGFHAFDSEKYDDVDGFNPCSEQSLEDLELCCLVESYPANHESFDDYLRTLKFAYLYAKTVTLVPTHDERTNAVMMRNRRIGCSMSGVQQAIKKFGLHTFLSKYCDKGYEEIKKWDRVYSRWLGVPRSIKMTTIKPSGSVSLLAGATPGVHCTHSEYYMRTIRVAGNSPFFLALLEAGYRIEPNANDRKVLRETLLAFGYTEETVDEECEQYESYVQTDPVVLANFGSRGGTFIVYFPVKEENFTKSKFETSLWEQLALVREMQYYWSDNSVSCTVTVKEEEKKDLELAIRYFAPYTKTLSFLPLTNHKYKQAPYQEISKEEYEKYASSLKPLHLGSGDAIVGSKFCTNDTCEV